MKLKQKNKIKFNCYKKGVSIIEALVLVFVFSLVTVSFYSVFSVGSRYVISSKNKIIATALANERMELLRNLPYADVAVVGGIPAGPIDPDEDISLEGRTFRIITDIRFYDDPMDGIAGGSPDDGVANDYKIAEVSVFWGGDPVDSKTERATLSSRFVPPGVETSVGGATFSINAIDYAGNPVPSVNINVYNDNLSPTVDYTTHTDANGNLLLQGVLIDTGQNYKITMNKTNYEMVVTYSPLTAGFIPEDQHSTIIGGALNQKVMRIDLLSDITLKSRDPFGEVVPSVFFDVKGGRQLDNGSVPGGEKYNFNQSITTDSSGEFFVENISPGNFSINELTFLPNNYLFWKVDSSSGISPAKFSVSPGADFSTDVIMINRDLDGVLIRVLTAGTTDSIEGAEVKLTNSILGYDETLITDKYGYAYFPKEISKPLINGATYEIAVSAAGYQTKSSSITINKLSQAEIKLQT